MITYAVESWTDFRPEAEVLFPLHWEEVALNKEEIPLKVAYEQYDAQDAQGALFIATVRAAGRLIGYWAGFVRPHFHYADSLTAYNDVYFVEKEFRYNGTGAGLFRFVEKQLKARGVQRVFNATKIHLDHSPLFAAMGYTATEIVHSKML